MFKATLNKSVRVEPVETLPLQINNLRRTSTGSVRTGRLIQHCLKRTAVTELPPDSRTIFDYY